MMRQMAGYTIVETMIFMAVSGLLFAMVIVSFNGRQDRTRFSQSVRDLETKISDVINDVSTGYYPNTRVSCTATATDITFDESASSEQGTNQGCIFLGKALNFNRLGSGDFEMSIMTIGGLRESTDLNSANPTVATSRALTESYQVKWGAQVRGLIYDSNSRAGAIVAVHDYEQASSNTKSSITGPVGTTIDQSDNQIADSISTTNWTGFGKEVTICIFDEKTNDTAAIVVNGSGSNQVQSFFNGNGASSQCAS